MRDYPTTIRWTSKAEQREARGLDWIWPLPWVTVRRPRPLGPCHRPYCVCMPWRLRRAVDVGFWAVSLSQWNCGVVRSEGDSGLKIAEETISGAYFTASTASEAHECCHIRRPRLRDGASCCTKPCHGQLVEWRFSRTGTARLQFSPAP